MFDIRLSRLIAPSYFDLWRDARAGRCDELWLYGGRGSGKSSFVALYIVCGLMDEPEANAIVYRKVAETLRESVYAQLRWAIDLLGVSDWFRMKLSPLEIEYIPTGQRILFRGSDRPEKSKGVKLVKGYFKYLWFEELTEFSGMRDIRTIKASILRGTQERTLIFYSYNPPMSSANNWVNAEARRVRKGPHRPQERLPGHPQSVAGGRVFAGSGSAEGAKPARVPPYVPGRGHGHGGAGV